MNKKIAGVSIVCLVGAIVGLGAFWLSGNGRMLRLPGIVEIQEVRLGSKIGGRIARVMIQEGDLVSPGMPLVVIEAPELENQRKQTQARLDAALADWQKAVNGARVEEKSAALAAARAAKARSDRAEYGWRDEEKEQAKNEWESADADYQQAEKEFVRVTGLYRMLTVSRFDYDAALAARDRARGRVEAARQRKVMMERGSREEDKREMAAEAERVQAQYEQLKNGNRWEDVALAWARVAELQAKIEEIDINLKEATVLVPPQLGRASVEVLAIRPGDLVAPNQPVLRILQADDLWVKVFVPETKMGLMTNGKEVDVTIDTYPGKRYKGVVKQMSSISEFTPRNVQSVDERSLQVFGVKIRVVDPQGAFRAGMAAEVILRLD